MSEPAILATDITKSFGKLAVLREVSLSVEAGTVFALLGPNGAGKTTMINVLSTLLRPDSGKALVAGHDIEQEVSLVRRRIALTGQFVAVDELQTGHENLVMMGKLCRLGGAESRRRATALLEQFGLADAQRRTVKTYSGGMRRRLDLAASLIGRPSVIFLDEPTTGLDPRSRLDMWGVVRDLVGSGVTVFLTTQYLEEADRLADRIAVIDNGRLVAEGTAAELKERVAGQRLDLLLTDARAYEAAASLLGANVIHREAAEYRIGLATDGAAAHVRTVLDDLERAGIGVQTLALHSASLDDVFLSLTGHRPDGQAAADDDDTGAHASPREEIAHV